MNKLTKGILTLGLAGAVLAGGSVLAADLSQKIDVYYRNISLYVNGAQIVPKDAKGNVVEPFIYNGTTYLPVRAVGEALGMDVQWDGKTASAYLGKKDQNQPDTYLSKLQWNDYQERAEKSSISVINGTVTDYNGNSYTSGLLFSVYEAQYHWENKYDNCNALIAYPLNSSYRTLTGKIVLPKSYNLTTTGKKDCECAPTDVYIYGDDELLYKATGVTNSMPFSFTADVRGVNQLEIRINVSNGEWYSYKCVALTDLALYE